MSKIIVIGGVAGGATAAARLRRLNEHDEIIMFQNDEYISFANCGMPYYIGGVIDKREKLLVQTAAGMEKRYDLDIRNLTEVTKIDREKNTVTAKDLATGEVYEEDFDKLILSPGAEAIKPNIKGIDEAENAFVLRSMSDTDEIKKFLTESKPKSALIVGGGFIGIEMAENLTEAGTEVTIVEKTNKVLKTLDYEMAQAVHRELNANGVKLIFGDGVSKIRENGRNIVLESGKEIRTDMIILAVGVTPDSSLAKAANLRLGERGYIVTNKRLQTIDKDTGKAVENIYAIGDAAEVLDFVDGKPTAIPLAWEANRQGRLAADFINGLEGESSKVLGASVAKVFSLTAAAVGNNEEQLRAKGIKYEAIHAHRANHAAYYPGSSNIALKLLFDKETGKIYGAQAVGKDGTEKRIDVISTAMKLGGTIRDLPDLEICYAPPYSSAKDPVNILGYIASNVADNVYKTVQWHEIDDIVKKGGYLLDVRTPFEFEKGHIEGSVNIEVDKLRERLTEIKVSKDTPVYVTCQVGMRAYIAIMILKGNGFKNLFNLSGGYLTYKTAKYKINSAKTERTAAAPDVDEKVNALKK